MNVLTATIAFTIVQLCVSLVMAGLYFAARKAKYTSYWAIAGLLIGVGTLVVALNAGAPRFAVLIAGNNLLFIGAILQWIGIRLFNQKRTPAFAWLIGAGFFASYGLLLINDAPVANRALAMSVWTLIILGLTFQEIRACLKKQATFGSIIGMTALALLITCYAGRVIGTLFYAPAYLPASPSLTGMFLIYLGPMAGIQLLFNGLLLLHFEKIVREKNHQATHDSLTGILNRNAIDAAGERELEVAVRLNRTLCVAYVDIDHFKQINDRLGHEIGDQVLATTAAILKQNCRSIDLVGRNGGDEFCLIMPGVEPSYLANIGDRLVNAVRAHDFPGAGTVSISIGMAFWSSEAGQVSWKSLLRCADTELYKAKERGRGRFSMRDCKAQQAA